MDFCTWSPPFNTPPGREASKSPISPVNPSFPEGGEQQDEDEEMDVETPLSTSRERVREKVVLPHFSEIDPGVGPGGPRGAGRMELDSPVSPIDN